jgi:hypothetical protein
MLQSNLRRGNEKKKKRNGEQKNKIEKKRRGEGTKE